MRRFLVSAPFAACLAVTACGPRVHPHQDTEISVDCGRGKGFDYCIYTAPPINGRRSPDLLYFLHGGGDSAETWGRWAVGKEYFRSYRERGLPAPPVVAVSFGRLWLLAERGGAPESGLLERFMDEAMPFVEKKTGAPGRRLLWGMSMGGFNALQLSLKRPELWKSVVLSCPGITALAPQASAPEIKDYISRTGADASKVDFLLGLAKSYFPNAESWERHDPLALAAAAGTLPPMLVECGDRDQYGFFEGSKRLSDILSSGGHAVQFERVPGGAHCAVPTDKVLRFLQAASD